MELLSRTHPATRSHPTRNGGFRALVSLYRQRRALGKLDDTALNDIGISRADAMQEARRALWDFPAHWKA